MPELPEVEVLVRNLDRLLPGKKIRTATVHRQKVLRKTTSAQLLRALRGATFERVTRRGKYLLFHLHGPKPQRRYTLLGHLGMTGRMYLAQTNTPLPKHAAVVLNLGRRNFIFEDTRYFGSLTLDTSPLDRLGPEPLDKQFTAKAFTERLRRSSQPIKVKLLDQTVVAGVGNIYASEALFRAGISPMTPAGKLKPAQVGRLRRSIRKVLLRAIRFGSTVPLAFASNDSKNALFYYGARSDNGTPYEERLLVYDRHGQTCTTCGTLIKRIYQAGRSTFYCGQCQDSAM